MTIGERLAKLERDNRRCRRLLVGLVLLLGVTLNWGPERQPATANAAVQGEKIIDNLRVRQLQVVNKNGKNIITLRDGAAGRGLMTISGVGDEKAHYLNKGVALFNKQGKVAVLLAMDEDAGSGMMVLNNPRGKGVVHLGSSKESDNAGYIFVKNAFGKVLWISPVE